MLESPAVIVAFVGPMELTIGFAIVVLLFGAKKIPELARSSGEAIGEFKKGRQELEEEFEEIEDELEQSVDQQNNAVSGRDPREEVESGSVTDEKTRS